MSNEGTPRTQFTVLKTSPFSNTNYTRHETIILKPYVSRTEDGNTSN